MNRWIDTHILFPFCLIGLVTKRRHDKRIFRTINSNNQPVPIVVDSLVCGMLVSNLRKVHHLEGGSMYGDKMTKSKLYTIASLERPDNTGAGRADARFFINRQHQ